jgi:hypothetical protein
MATEADRDEMRDWWLATIGDLMDRGWTPVSMAWDNLHGSRYRIFPELDLEDDEPIGRGPRAVEQAQALIGRRIRGGDHKGVIVDVVQTRNGYVRWLVEWEAGTPTWWSREVAPTADGVELLPDPPIARSGWVCEECGREWTDGMQCRRCGNRTRIWRDYAPIGRHCSDPTCPGCPAEMPIAELPGEPDRSRMPSGNPDCP